MTRTKRNRCLRSIHLIASFQTVREKSTPTNLDTRIHFGWPLRNLETLFVPQPSFLNALSPWTWINLLLVPAENLLLHSHRNSWMTDLQLDQTDHPSRLLIAEQQPHLPLLQSRLSLSIPSSTLSIFCPRASAVVNPCDLPVSWRTFSLTGCLCLSGKWLRSVLMAAVSLLGPARPPSLTIPSLSLRSYGKVAGMCCWFRMLLWQILSFVCSVKRIPARCQSAGFSVNSRRLLIY